MSHAEAHKCYPCMLKISLGVLCLDYHLGVPHCAELGYRYVNILRARKPMTAHIHANMYHNMKKRESSSAEGV